VPRRSRLFLYQAARRSAEVELVLSEHQHEFANFLQQLPCDVAYLAMSLSYEASSLARQSVCNVKFLAASLQ